MTEFSPLTAWQQGQQIFFDGDGVCGGREVEATAKSADMGVHHNTLVFAETDAENDIGGFARHARQGEQVRHIGGNSTLESLHDDLCGGADVTGFVPIKAGGINRFLQFEEIAGGVISRFAVTSEQFVRYRVDAFVRALCGKNHGDQQFEGGAEIQGAARMGIAGG